MFVAKAFDLLFWLDGGANRSTIFIKRRELDLGLENLPIPDFIGEENF
jgi:hypothetical protein